jgi:hypothetical protein
MLDNLTGSGLSESEVVQKLQAGRGGEEQDSAPIESTDETGDEESQAESYEGPDEEVGGDEAQDEFEETEEAVETYRIKASGEELDVTFDQLVQNFERGQDYYKKTQAVADQRKALDVEKADFLKVQEEQKQILSAQIENLKQFVSEQEQSIDWEELRDTDPSEYLRQKEKQEARVKALSEAQQNQEQELAVKRQELLNIESKKLLDAMGESWQDEKARNKDLEGMYEFAYQQGISKDEVSNILDHRFWLILHKAMKFDELKKTGETVKQQVKSAPKTVKSGRPQPRKQQKAAQDARQQLRSSGGKDLDAAVALMKAKRNNR